jgi:hypothetical protein
LFDGTQRLGYALFLILPARRHRRTSVLSFAHSVSLLSLDCGAKPVALVLQRVLLTGTGRTTVMVNTNDYGLELTNNSKVGWAFSLPRSRTCVNSTITCRKLCYGNGIRYQSDTQKNKRERNFRTCEFLLAAGGPELLAENLGAIVEQARPRDWLAAKINKVSTRVPWTLRIQDVGDFYSVKYIQAWTLVVRKYPKCAFWFYTRSFIEPTMFAALTELAQLENCQGWLSIDSDNYNQGIIAKCQSTKNVWKLALLQDKELADGVMPAIKEVSKNGMVVNFPYHHGGRHVEPIDDKVLVNCPAVTGSLKLSSKTDALRPCQQCSFCLP